MSQVAVARSRATQLDALTGLRFLAAMHVVLFHLMQGYLTRVPAPIGNLLSEGPESVTIFFILSGFVLAYTYRERAAQDPRPYAWARVARVYPMYLFALVMALPMFIGHPPQYDSIQLDASPGPFQTVFNTHFVAGAACLLLMQAWIPPAALKWNYPGWSLSAEAFFYVLFPRMARFVAHQPLRRLRAMALGAWLASLALATGWMLVNQQLPPEHVVRVWWGDVLQFNPLIRLPEFVLGVIIGFRFMQGPIIRLSARVSMLATVAVIGVWMVHWSGMASNFENAMLLPVYACLVLTLAYGQGWFARWLASRPMVLLGHASYALYLLHAPIIFYASRLMARRAPGTGYVLAAAELAMTALVAVLAALLAYRYVEEPARRGIRRWSERVVLPPRHFASPFTDT